MAMSLRNKFILFIIVIHSVAVALSFFVFRENKLLFLAAEFFVLISLAICWSLYREPIQPMRLMLRGIDAIRDQAGVGELDHGALSAGVCVCRSGHR